MRIFYISMMRSVSLRRRIALIMAIFAVSLLIIALHTVPEHGPPSMAWTPVISDGTSIYKTPSAPHRKLLGRGNQVEPNRMGHKCSKSDIVINQGATPPLPNGIPTYTVEITNVCATSCDITGIHLHCGSFSSTRLINPQIFKRLRIDDCLVNDGKPLIHGRTISFQYANTFRYPLSVSSLTC